MAPALRLVTIDDDLLRTLVEGGDALADVRGASLGGNTTIVREVVEQTLALHADAPRAPTWGGYLVVDDTRATVVGTCGFVHGPEADGSVEIAYFTFPEFEGRGYATAMAAALLELARQSDAVREVVAHTLPESNASTRILEKIGLTRAGVAHDDDAGAVWRWASPVSGTSPRP